MAVGIDEARHQAPFTKFNDTCGLADKLRDLITGADCRYLCADESDALHLWKFRINGDDIRSKKYDVRELLIGRLRIGSISCG